MNDNQEITIRLEDSDTQTVCDCSVGFLILKVDGMIETAEPAGTGTFVKLHKTHGILTAAHVIDALGSTGTVGLVRFPSITPVLQNCRLNLEHTERLKTWNGIDGEAPDIAFLKIPDVDAGNLEAKGAVFYNLGLARKFEVSNPGHKMSKCYAVVGVIGEWTEQATTSPTGHKKIDVNGLFGNAKKPREFKEKNADLVEVEIDHAEGPKVPQSYGGVSGGGLWELYVD